jgi:hypothetical protein
MVQIDPEEEEETSSYHSCEGSLLVVPSPFFCFNLFRDPVVEIITYYLHVGS